MKLRTLAVCAALALTTACSGLRPIQNYASVPAVRYDGTSLSQERVAQAIIRGGASKGWVVQPKAPGRMLAILNLRSHQAVVEITYTDRDYSITYQSSINLDVDGDRINKNYNRWLENLRQAITSELQRV